MSLIHRLTARCHRVISKDSRVMKFSIGFTG